MDDEQQFCLKWNNHQSTLVSVFESLLRRNLLVDCTLAAEGRSMKAHKVILSACSPYFESLLGDHFDKHPVFILKDVKFKELEAMMDYMYKGEVNVSQDQLGPLLKAAESLQIKGLSDNRRDSRSTNDERRREPAAPVRDKSPPPAPTLPQVKGLVIEQKKELLLNNREGSQSPGRRKKRRRQSLDDTGNDSSIENHDGASNGSSSVSVSQTNVPPNVPLNDSRSDLTSASSLIKAKEEIMSQVPQVKQKLEPHSELMLEPKSEYIEEDMNDDSIEDLTLDDDELDMDHSRPGPSHGGQGDGSNQGFGSWQMDPSQDETFMAAQEAVGQHRDAQGPCSLKKPPTACKKCQNWTPTPLSFYLKQFLENKGDPLFVVRKRTIANFLKQAEKSIELKPRELSSPEVEIRIKEDEVLSPGLDFKVVFETSSNDSLVLESESSSEEEDPEMRRASRSTKEPKLPKKPKVQTKVKNPVIPKKIFKSASLVEPSSSSDDDKSLSKIQKELPLPSNIGKDTSCEGESQAESLLKKMKRALNAIVMSPPKKTSNKPQKQKTEAENTQKRFEENPTGLKKTPKVDTSLKKLKSSKIALGEKAIPKKSLTKEKKILKKVKSPKLTAQKPVGKKIPKKLKSPTLLTTLKKSTKRLLTSSSDEKPKLVGSTPKKENLLPQEFGSCAKKRLILESSADELLTPKKLVVSAPKKIEKQIKDSPKLPMISLGDKQLVVSLQKMPFMTNTSKKDESSPALLNKRGLPRLKTKKSINPPKFLVGRGVSKKRMTALAAKQKLQKQLALSSNIAEDVKSSKITAQKLSPKFKNSRASIKHLLSSSDEERNLEDSTPKQTKLSLQKMGSSAKRRLILESSSDDENLLETSKKLMASKPNKNSPKLPMSPNGETVKQMSLKPNTPTKNGEPSSLNKRGLEKKKGKKPTRFLVGRGGSKKRMAALEAKLKLTKKSTPKKL